MANFNTEVNITPDRGLKADSKPKVLIATYGDGYEQRVAAGINNTPEVWNLTWKNRTAAEANKIVKFLETQGGITAFDWYPPSYDISSTTTSASTNKLIDTSQYFTARYLNTTVTYSAGSGASLTSSIAAGAVTSVAVDSGGSSYSISPPPIISFSGGGGSGASAIPTIAGGIITSITVTAGGSGYTSAPIVTVSSSSTTAVVTAVDSATQLSLSTDILSSGESYTIYPYKKYKCDKWSTQEVLQGVRTITATFTKVFEP